MPDNLRANHRQTLCGVCYMPPHLRLDIILASPSRTPKRPLPPSPVCSGRRAEGEGNGGGRHHAHLVQVTVRQHHHSPREARRPQPPRRPLTSLFFSLFLSGRLQHPPTRFFCLVQSRTCLQDQMPAANAPPPLPGRLACRRERTGQILRAAALFTGSLFRAGSLLHPSIQSFAICPCRVPTGMASFDWSVSPRCPRCRADLPRPRRWCSAVSWLVLAEICEAGWPVGC